MAIRRMRVKRKGAGRPPSARPVSQQGASPCQAFAAASGGGGGRRRRGGLHHRAVLPQCRGPVRHRVPGRLGERLARGEVHGVERRVQQHAGTHAAPLGEPPGMGGEVHVAVPGEERARGAPRRQPAEPVIDERDRLDQRPFRALGEGEEWRCGRAARASRPSSCPRGTAPGCRRPPAARPSCRAPARWRSPCG